MKKYIDTDKDPILPSWATLVSHKKMGKIEWKQEDFELYLSEEQKTGSIKGNELYEKIKNTNVMNINVAQFFLDNLELYPVEWKKKYIYFYGTIVRARRGALVVPYLCENCDEMILGWGWLGSVWSDIDPALRIIKIPESND